jgi:hypothetical protein
VTPLETALLAQKKTISAKIATAQDADELGKAFGYLLFVQDVLAAAGDRDAVRDLRTRIAARAKRLADVDRDYVSKLRKNALTRASTETNIRKLDELAAIDPVPAHFAQ